MQQVTKSGLGAGAIAVLRTNMAISPITDVWRDRIHDLGNLIQVASSAISIMARDLNPRDEERARMVVSAARSSLERASLIVRTGLRNPRECPVGGTTVVSECFTHLRLLGTPLVGSRISLDFAIEPGLPAIGCDAGCLEKALVNLVINAKDAMPDGGHMTISARVDGPNVVVAVKDSGCGMSPAQLGRATQPFYTTKPTGTGVGLASVRDFMEMVGGGLFIASEQGIGTCVELRFPVMAN